MITFRCPGCSQSRAWIPGYSVKEIKGVITFVDRENLNCRLYQE